VYRGLSIEGSLGGIIFNFNKLFGGIYLHPFFCWFGIVMLMFWMQFVSKSHQMSNSKVVRNKYGSLLIQHLYKARNISASPQLMMEHHMIF